jgi:hypothetical protein
VTLRGTNVPRPPGLAPNARLRWTAAICVVAAIALASAEWHGRSSRIAFHAPARTPQFRLASVRDVADAFLVWRESSHGRRLVVLTGRWSGPRTSSSPGASAGDAPLGSGLAGDPLTADSALYWAARLGVVRSFDVVMPPALFERRAAEDAGHRPFEAEDGAFRHDLNGLRLRFALPRAFVAPAEPALVLVEPTWFSAGAPPDPLAWLASAGVRTDLVLLALDDPDATDGERRAATAYARSANAPRLNVVRTP